MMTLLYSYPNERWPYLDHSCHVALWPCIISLVFLPHQHYEVQVVPDVVLHLDVLFKGNCLVVKFIPLQAWRREPIPISHAGPADKLFAQVSIINNERHITASYNTAYIHNVKVKIE